MLDFACGLVCGSKTIIHEIITGIKIAYVLFQIIVPNIQIRLAPKA